MTPRDAIFASLRPRETEDGLEDLIVELDGRGVVEHTSRPDWAGDGVPRPGEPITEAIALEGAGLRAALERTHRTGRSERVVARMLWTAELHVVTGRLTPRGDGSGHRGWFLILRRGPDLPTRLLEASPGILMRAVEQMSFGVTLSDRDGRILYTNRAETEMHGYAPGELLGRFVHELGVSGETMPPPESAPETPWRRNRVNRRKDGSLFPIRLTSDEIRDEEDHLLGRVTITEDIAEHARLERMKEEFIRIVSHELRTPLTSILASLSLLQGDSPRDERRDEALAIAERNSRHLLELVHDLLDFQNAVAGNLEMEMKSTPVVSILEEAAEQARTSRPSRSGIPRSRIVISHGDLPETVCVRADRTRLLQVLDQLVSNALSFSSAMAPVRLHAARGPERTTLMVTDQGPGIPYDVRRRLFEPFSPADASTTRRDSGPGLGLALAKALVESMNGELELIPEEGAPFGSTFLIHLPNA